MCSKRRRVERNGSDTESNSFPTGLEVLVFNGEWDTAETVPSIIGEMCSVTLPNLDALNEFCVPCSESSRSEISTEDDYSHVNVKTEQPSAKQRETNPSYPGFMKPPFTYTELIQQALKEKGELTASEIYKWISEHFPFYKPDDDRWKNSVRHNLSISPHFQKGNKAPNGVGHLWVLAESNKYFQTVEKMKQHFKRFLAATVTTHEVQEATASIQSNNESQDLHNELLLSIEAENSQLFQGTSSYTLPLSPLQRISLEQSAEEILSGVKKDVQVQYLVPVNEESLSKKDFLNPLSREEVVEESGLLGQVGDIGSSNLALTTYESDIITLEFPLPDDTDFQYSELISLPLEL
ncbi:hypothetical protein B7P43_G03944 [Cryptotermes secundus]|uniref:Fork-head domain-containing protein n=1 Tax=Cryptotermes secundus TaxID=105785 RepID=A0A2J7RCN7_9NEOP|nr:hypothetical protein B7P43_G03944 [Cryptotermes secundus]